MGITTGIEWCDSTQNPAMGCDGCELWPGDNAPKEKKRCYAGNLTQFHGGPGKKGWPEAFDKPQIFPGRIEKALKWSDLTGKDREDKPWLNGYPRMIFLGDMGDNFTESLDLMWMAPYVSAMAASPHIFIMLTKRPARMREFWSEWCALEFDKIPPNFWLLTSVTGPENVNRIRELLKLRALGAKVLGVSLEPLWGPVIFAPWLPVEVSWCTHEGSGFTESHTHHSERLLGLDWVISGGESGALAKPSHPAWFRDARDACLASGTAFFFKQWGEWAPEPFAQIARAGGKFSPPEGMIRPGKKATGALLDGREWRQMPEARS